MNTLMILAAFRSAVLQSITSTEQILATFVDFAEIHLDTTDDETLDFIRDVRKLQAKAETLNNAALKVSRSWRADSLQEEDAA